MKPYERFLEYLKIGTMSDRRSTTSPSTMRLFNLAHLLAYELKNLGLTDVEVTNHGIVYGRLSATAGLSDRPRIGFLAHMDTSPDFNGLEIHPQVIPDYDGTDVALGTSGLTLRVSDYPHLASLKDRTLITTDGTSLLGADDKAGIAEIMAALETIIQENIPHGEVDIAFVSDEEIGHGTDHFDPERFGAQFAYTVDGLEAGEIGYENFNAAELILIIHGKKAHTGFAKHHMVNANLVGIEINNLLPPEETPMDTEGREGFYHLNHSHGDVTEAMYVYEIRDFEESGLKSRIQTLTSLADQMNGKYGEGTVSVTVRELYKNMRPITETCGHLIENAKKAAIDAGITPVIRPLRGGTSGAKLSYRGLPCPNLGVGGREYHGPLEYITAEDMELVSKILVNIVKEYSRA